jgi:hypothetical protein
MKIKSIIPIAISLLITGCTSRVTDFTFISTKNMDLTRVAEFKRGTTRVKGEDKKSIIIIIPTGEPNAKEAIDRAIQQQPGAIALLDGVIYKHGWYIPYIYGQFSFEVEGTPLIDPKL